MTVVHAGVSVIGTGHCMADHHSRLPSIDVLTHQCQRAKSKHHSCSRGQTGVLSWLPMSLVSASRQALFHLS